MIEERQKKEGILLRLLLSLLTADESNIQKLLHSIHDLTLETGTIPLSSGTGRCFTHLLIWMSVSEECLPVICVYNSVIYGYLGRDFDESKLECITLLYRRPSVLSPFRRNMCWEHTTGSMALQQAVPRIQNSDARKTSMLFSSDLFTKFKMEVFKVKYANKMKGTYVGS